MQNEENGELAVPMYPLTYVKSIKRRIQTVFLSPNSYGGHNLWFIFSIKIALNLAVTV